MAMVGEKSQGARRGLGGGLEGAGKGVGGRDGWVL
jgi:hypothetical protein